jgi:hypothetical protein
MSVGVLAMIPWTVFLSLSLPVRFKAHDWNVTWVGFDSALIVVLAANAWAAWFRRQILAATSLVAATMLLCDAWFDVNTSIGTKDQWLSILTALIANIPMAALFIILTRHIMLQTAAALVVALNIDEPPHHAHRVSLPFSTTWHEGDPLGPTLGTSASDGPDPPASAEWRNLLEPNRGWREIMVDERQFNELSSWLSGVVTSSSHSCAAK